MAFSRPEQASPITLLPPEIVSRILDFVRDRDFCAATEAHRAFCVASACSVARRRERHWLRTSPERAYTAGRIDILAFLWRRKRIPRTFDLWQRALASCDVALVTIAMQQDSSMEKLDEARKEFMRKDAVNALAVLMHCMGGTVDETIDQAIVMRATKVFASLLDVTTHIRPRHWAQKAARSGNVEALRILFDRYPWIPLGAVAEGAMLSHDPVGVLSLIHRRDPLFPWQCALMYAARRGSVQAIDYIARQLAPRALDFQAALVEAARHGRERAVYLLGQWPVCLQEAADASDERGGVEGLRAVVRVHIGRMANASGAAPCPDEPPLDLQKVLEQAVERDWLGEVRFIINESGVRVDLESALAVARSPLMAEFIAGVIASGNT
ncbi:Ankyrin repeat protein [Pandoravirus kuranda]|uniref:Ankyrin repeat protein n=1 Tax=Pandoravirus kuranda TaxID=3019033 RepID=A0AA95ECM9_9VIRU|nr:Ankyrin repeat protein [Pandoravirus kuranda]